MQKVYVFVTDSGDGSSATWFTRLEDTLERLDNDDPSWVYQNEGDYQNVFTFPDDLDLEACGFTFFEDEM
jgi:hypothetical protein